MDAFEAAKRGSVEAIQSIDPDMLAAVDKFGKTPMHHAAENGHAEVIEVLARLAPHTLASRVVDHVGPTQIAMETPMHCAALKGCTTAIEVLARLAPETLSVRTHWECTPMHYAASNGQTEAVLTLERLAPGAALAVDDLGTTSMHLAAEGGHVETLEALARLAPETLSARVRWGVKPMHRAAVYDQVEAIEFLARHAPQTLEATTRYGETPMHKATLSGPVTPKFVATLETLVRLAPGTALALDDRGRTPLDFANEKSCRHVIAAHVPLTESHWASLACPAEELEKLLPIVLKRSKAEAGWLVKKLPESSRKRVQGVLLTAHRLGLPTGLEESWLA